MRIVIAIVALVAVAGAAAGQRLQSFETSALTIVAAGKAHPFTVELALTPAQQAQGLMFRRTLAADAGMLFVYPHDAVLTMWMRNTYVPLDMLFIAADGTVVSIAERAVPLSDRTISSGARVRAVLEVNAGTVRRLGIRPGDRVVHPLLGG